MKREPTLILTGAAGFIGSVTAGYLNSLGYTRLILVDDFGIEGKRANWSNKQFIETVERLSLENWLAEHNPSIDAVVHLGARTDTTEFDYSIHQLLNVDYSQMLWRYCSQKQIPLIYASSAATYGNGALGYADNHQLPFLLQPLNPYGVSKNEFDKWALLETNQPPFWAGLKFFNVYGPNEYHKGRMASVIWHASQQINAHGQVNLFKSHRPDFADGQQLRDFIYVKDVVAVIGWMLDQMLHAAKPFNNGLYNLGTGQARSFYDLAVATFRGLAIEPHIEFIDMPLDIRDKYQYFTEAEMQKLRQAGYTAPFYSLEQGVQDYVGNYLASKSYY